MAELVRSNPEDAASFLERIGLPIPKDKIIEVFPGYFPERRVLHVQTPGKEASRVIKIRPDDKEAREEARKLRILLAQYRFFGAHYQDLDVKTLPQSKYIAMNMPYLGVNLIELESDMFKLGQEKPANTFTGFSEKQIRALIGRLRTCHGNFSGHYQLVHGDLFVENSPNNIVYQANMGKLFLVDAEALTEATEEAISRFDYNVGKVEEWMFANLYKNGK